MTPQQFITKWRAAKLTERSAAQQHFLDLCELLGQPKPAEADPDGAWYTFERGVHKMDGGDGWADVWMRGHFGWEYKGKHRDLRAAYNQLLQYREDLENPPLLVVCDLDRFEVHTNFTGTAKKVYAFDLDGLAEPTNLDVLRKLFTDPDGLRPGETSQAITEQAAELFGQLADGLRVRGIEAQEAAHFLMKLMFCMFAEDIELLPNRVFSRTLAGARKDPARLSKLLKNLFEAMSTGGNFGADEILYFNGGLFADAEVIDLKPGEIDVLVTVSQFDWGAVEPSIFGTLFERTLDPAKRSQIGAHYTSRDDILTLLEPVMMAPLRREWADVKRQCEVLWSKVEAKVRKEGAHAAVRVSKGKKFKESAELKKFDRRIQEFIERLSHVTVLDPACGSGNFLYVALHLLLNLEKEVITFAANHGVTQLPHVRPTQLSGIEINPFAQELAQVVIWIGYLQWMRDNGFAPPSHPVLEPIETIRRMDAILDTSDPEHPKEPEWPEAEVIVGNPPFLGDKKLRTSLGHDYVDALFHAYGDRIPNQADICCYWFERAREAIKAQKCRRAGLLATQGIRGGASREVLHRIKQTGDIFFAVSDRDWILDGANVHVSMIGFDAGAEKERILDGNRVSTINANLTSTADTTAAKALSTNEGISFQGPVKVGSFEITDDTAVRMLTRPNPHGRPNSDVIRPWINGISITQQPERMWIIDFVECPLDEASKYGEPFEHVREHVKPERDKTRRERRRKFWWIHGEVNNAYRAATGSLSRVIATCQTAKHRMFVWLDQIILPAQTVIAFARDDDYFFGVLHSRAHEVWALKLGTRLETRPRYTPTTCFETFPFPESSSEQSERIAEAARELDRLRTGWLNPPEWTREEVLAFPGSASGPWARYVHDPDSRGIGTVRYPRRVPNSDEAARELAKRTLTNLYNQRPTWLALAHQTLDSAVFAAYGWPDSLTDDEILERLLSLNLHSDPVKKA